MTRRNRSTGAASRRAGSKLYSLVLIGIMALLVAACAAEPEIEPTPNPTATATRPPLAVNNDNVEALNAAQAALNQFQFGFAPLLEQDGTRLVLETGPAGPVARLAYPLQPADPRDWPAMDSFILAYAVQQALLESPQVRRAGLSRFDVAAAIGPEQKHVEHVAVWVRFTDGSQAVVDLSPLGTNYGARHPTRELLTEPDQIEPQFERWRRGVFLDVLQPMKVVEAGRNVYYVLAGMEVSPEFYTFSIRVHQAQTADPMRPLLLTRGAVVTAKIHRANFETVQKLVRADGPEAFVNKPDLTNRTGDNDPALNKILDEQLYLLWHMVTKIEQKSAPPVATPTPTPVPTPTPTPTRSKLPLLTS